MAQIKTNISDTEKERLDGIVKKYRFKSRYQVVQYLIKCFLRTADPENDTSKELFPDEIKDMFAGYDNNLSNVDFDTVKDKKSI